MAFNYLMHARNIYRNPPDFSLLASEFPEFAKFVIEKGSKTHVDFKDHNALRALTTVLLKKDFNLIVAIPQNCLIPTVPQRLNYILWIEDLLQMLPKKSTPCEAIDIGTGPCCIFPLLGARKNDWHFTATEVNEESAKWAQRNIDANKLNQKISVMKVSGESMIMQLLTEEKSQYDVCMCNPPFFGNVEDFQRKRKFPHDRQQQEILVDGGEVTFVKTIIDESKIAQEKVQIYTSMLGRKKSLDELLKYLKTIPNTNCTTCEFGQGNTVRWGIAWTYVPNTFNMVKTKKSKTTIKDAFTFTIPTLDGKSPTIEDILPKLQVTLDELQIPYVKLLEEKSTAHFQIVAYKNTWVNQRRRRRELLKAKEQVIGDSATITMASTEGDGCARKSLNSSNNNSLENLHKQIEMEPAGKKDPVEQVNSLVVVNSHENLNMQIKSDPINTEDGQIEPLLNCNIVVHENNEGVALKFSCAATSPRETTHQIYLLLRNKLTTL